MLKKFRDRLRTKDRIVTLEVVLDAVISLLEKRDIIGKDDVQLEILDRAGGNNDKQE